MRAISQGPTIQPSMVVFIFVSPNIAAAGERIRLNNEYSSNYRNSKQLEDIRALRNSFHLGIFAGLRLRFLGGE